MRQLGGTRVVRLATLDAPYDSRNETNRPPMKKAKRSECFPLPEMRVTQLLGGGGFRRGGFRGGGVARLLALVPVVFALELLDAARRVHVLHLAGEERVA